MFDMTPTFDMTTTFSSSSGLTGSGSTGTSRPGETPRSDDSRDDTDTQGPEAEGSDKERGRDKQTGGSAIDRFRRRVNELADALPRAGDPDVNNLSFGGVKATLPIDEGDLTLCVEGRADRPGQRMRVTAAYRKSLRVEMRRDESAPSIGASIMERPTEALARDIQRRLLSPARKMLRMLQSRAQATRQREKRAEAIAATISQQTGLDLERSPGRDTYSDRIRIGGERDGGFLSGTLTRIGNRDGDERVRLNITGLTAEEAIRIATAAEDVVDRRTSSSLDDPSSDDGPSPDDGSSSDDGSSPDHASQKGEEGESRA